MKTLFGHHKRGPSQKSQRLYSTSTTFNIPIIIVVVWIDPTDQKVGKEKSGIIIIVLSKRKKVE